MSSRFITIKLSTPTLSLNTKRDDVYIYIYIFILLTKSTYLSEGAVNFGSLMKIC